MAAAHPTPGPRFAKTAALVDAALYHLDGTAGHDHTADDMRQLADWLTGSDSLISWRSLADVAGTHMPSPETRALVVQALRIRADEQDNPPTEADIFAGFPKS